MTAEEKIKQLDETVKSIEGQPITPEIEFAVLSGKGIEYKTSDGFALLVPPLKISQFESWQKMIDDINNANTLLEIVKIKGKFIAEKCGVETSLIMDNFTPPDCENVLSVMLYSWLEGTSVYKKKVLSLSEIIRTCYQTQEEIKQG